MHTAAGSVKVALFGVFDGHGGKQAATYASNHMMPNLLEALQGASSPPESVRSQYVAMPHSRCGATCVWWTEITGFPPGAMHSQLI